MLNGRIGSYCCSPPFWSAAAGPDLNASAADLQEAAGVHSQQQRKQTRSKSHFTLPAPSPERNRDPLLLNAQVPRPLRSGGRFTLARIDPVFAGKTAGLPPTGSSLARRFSFLQFLHPPFHFHSLGRRRAKEKKTELARYYVGHCVGRSHSDEFRQALVPVPPACQHFPPPAS